MVCSYLNNLEQGQTETAHAILDKQGVEEGGRLETPPSCQGVEFSSQACPERSRGVS